MSSTTPPVRKTDAGSPEAASLLAETGEERNKRLVVHVITQLFDERNLDVAQEHIRADYIEHNPDVADGREGVTTFARDLHARYPDAKYNIKRVLAQGDLVVVHANPIHEPGSRGLAVLDMFRIEAGMVAEHWSSAQPVPATTVNGNDMFGTVTNPHTNQPSGSSARTPGSADIVTSYFQTLLVDKNPDAVGYLTPEFHQHNPAVPSGSTGLREQFAGFFRQFPDMTAELKRVVAEKDYVAIHFHHRLSRDERGQAVMGIFRVVERDGGEWKIIEHWDVIQEVPATSANDNTMF